METEKAIVAAGCFWGIEEAYRTLPGVKKTTVGYAGGKTDKPTYEEVSNKRTGHAESLLIEFDPVKISYEEILEKFWEIHDPTTVNRQGPDIGEQYRSVIFYLNDGQKKTAEKSRAEANQSGKFENPIATDIVPLNIEKFYPAEDYHQQYLAKRNLKTC